MHHLTVLPSTQSSLRLFGAERVVFWREVSAGASRTAYYVGKNIADLPRLFFVPAMYLSLFEVSLLTNTPAVH